MAVVSHNKTDLAEPVMRGTGAERVPPKYNVQQMQRQQA